MIMAMDTAAIVNGVVTGLIAHEMTKKETVETLLQELHITVKQLSMYLTQAMDTVDIYKVVTIYKNGLGPPYHPYTEGREYVRVFVGTSTVLNVGSILGIFNITLNPGSWQALDLPDGTTFVLDASYAQNTANIYVRYTDDKPAY